MSSTIWTERRKVAAMGGAILLLLAVTAPPLIAQSGGTVDLRWHALPSGGTRFSSGGNVMLGGSLGQFGPGRSVGGNASWWAGSGTPTAARPWQSP